MLCKNLISSYSVLCISYRQILSAMFRSKKFFKWIAIIFGVSLLYNIVRHFGIYIENIYSCKESGEPLSDNYNISGTLIVDAWWNLKAYDHKPNCNELLSVNDSDKDFEEKLHDEFTKWNPKIPSEDLFSSRTCEDIQAHFAIAKSPKSKMEDDYPLAYIFMGQRNIFQTLTLFGMIYWPQNIYCLNWDAKSNRKYINILRSLVACLPNVITPRIHRKIYWGEYSLLQATMDCVTLLNSYNNVSWNYMQIVSWNDFPLKTNYEMVQIFKTLNGANDVGLDLAFMHYVYKKCDPYTVGHCTSPGALVLYKGSYAVSLTRDFVRFMVIDKAANDLYKWLKDTWCAEEHYWSTLNHNLHLNPPGGYPGWCLQYYLSNNQSKPEITRLQQWSNKKSCRGKTTGGSCVYSVYDLAEIVQSKSLWAHKVYEEYHPAALYCLQKWFYDKLSQSSLSSKELAYYENLPYVRYHKFKDKKIGCFMET